MKSFFKLKFVWPLLFLLAFSVFFGRLWLNQFLDIKLRELAEFANKTGIALNGMRLVKLPPSLQFNSIEIPVRGKMLPILNPRLELGLLPPRLNFSAQALGGSLEGIAYLEIRHGPGVSLLNFSANNLRLEDLLVLSGLEKFAGTDGGKLNCSGHLKITKYIKSSPDWAAATGEANVALRDASLILKIPFLKNNRLDNVHGNLHARARTASLEVESCRFAAAPIFFEARGNIRPWFYPDRAQINLNTELRIPENLPEPALMPERTLAMIRQKGFVRAKIVGRLYSPEIYLEN